MRRLFYSAIMVICLMALLVTQATAAGTLTIYQDGEGNISITSPVSKVDGNVITCADGERITLNLVPNDGCKVASVMLNGVYQIIEGDGAIPFDVEPTGDWNIKVTFAKKQGIVLPSGNPISPDDIFTNTTQVPEPTTPPDQDPSGMGEIMTETPAATPKSFSSTPFFIGGFCLASLLVMIWIYKKRS